MALDERELSGIRGNRIGMIFQDPSVYLNPVVSVGKQIAEPLVVHRGMSRAAARRRAIELLDLVGVPEAARRVDQYPHEFSGGMRQRAVIASAIACDPALLIADEPTTALDVTVQAEILDLVRDLCAELDMGALLITHDMGVVADLADTVAVMKDGLLVETAPARELFAAPRDPYTKVLLAAVPRLGSSQDDASAPAEAGTRGGARVVQRPGRGAGAPSRQDQGVPALKLDDVSVVYRRRMLSPAFAAVDHVSLSLEPGELLGLVGESGSGKSTLAKTVVGLNRASSGRVLIGGVDVTSMGGRRLREIRHQYSIVFQDPAASLNPRRTVRDSLLEAVRMRGQMSSKEANRRVESLLDDVRLGSAYAGRYPRELSGASGSGSASPGRSRSSRGSSSPTSPRPRSTSRCSARSSNSSRSCVASTGSPASSSPTTSRWSSRSRTTSPSCGGVSSWSTGRPTRSYARRRPATPRSSSRPRR
ncbi:hypothetical protein GCM10025864_19510 [Luteimicrobium album]|uniref:ABC transporter domain-containing protein n=1 Tax=Luteimicrobium album TaxID=1054550 RepID=A0ABQ6I0P5_9MICO|nr:hypothetical protein GCM10025864_19510 [Luteimicrobium album]